MSRSQEIVVAVKNCIRSIRRADKGENSHIATGELNRALRDISEKEIKNAQVELDKVVYKSTVYEIWKAKQSLLQDEGEDSVELSRSVERIFTNSLFVQIILIL